MMFFWYRIIIIIFFFWRFLVLMLKTHKLEHLIGWWILYILLVLKRTIIFFNAKDVHYNFY